MWVGECFYVERRRRRRRRRRGIVTRSLLSAPSYGEGDNELVPSQKDIVLIRFSVAEMSEQSGGF